MYQDIHVADSILHDEVLAKWLAETYPEIFEIFNNEQLDNKVMEQLALNAICTELVRLQTQHKDIGKENKIQLVEQLPGIEIYWNQRFNQSENVISYSSANTTRTINSDGSYTFTLVTKPTSGAGNYNCTCRIDVNRTENHIYVQVYSVKVSKRAKVYATTNNWVSGIYIPADGEYHRVTARMSPTTIYPFYMGFQSVQQNADLTVGDYYTVKNWMIFDLTEMFGAGNEPTMEEFDIMFPENYYPYNDGEAKRIPITSIPENTIFFEIQNEEGE